jgi:hypothetical protein
VGEPGEVGSIALTSLTTLEWSATPDASIYNTYRGLIPAPGGMGSLPQPYSHVCFESGDAQLNGATLTVDDEASPEGAILYYLVDGELSCGEGTLGDASNGAMRPNPFPCSCDDRDPCTTDARDVSGACTHTPVPGCGSCPVWSCPWCPVVEICGNGIDDDCDGVADFADFESCPCPIQECFSQECPWGTLCATYGCCVEHCNDGVPNGSESDVDCGGACDDCAAGRNCYEGFDCISGVCISHTCQ